MAIGICKCGRRTVKHDNCAYTFKWLCESCREEIFQQSRVWIRTELNPIRREHLRDIFNSVLKRSA